MKVRIDGKEREFETIEDLEDAIDDALDDVEYARESGYDDGYEDGYHDAEFITDQDIVYGRRETDFRTDLYRAIAKGDIDKAREVMSLMAMVDIDRELIWQAKREVRK